MGKTNLQKCSEALRKGREMIYMLWNHTEKNTDEEKKLKRDICVCVLGGGGGFFWGGLHFCLLVLRHLCLILAACSPQGQYKK